MKTYTGSCHCGQVAFRVEADITEGLECNCSHCSKKGFLLAFVPTEQLTVTKGEDNLTSYLFNKKQIDHLFCKTCGVQAFSRGVADQALGYASINIRCLDDFDYSDLPRKQYDGKNM